jgi:hypothetical protein
MSSSLPAKFFCLSVLVLTQLTSLYFGCHIIIFRFSSWPHVNILGFCLEILNNAIIAALVDLALPSNPEDMLCACCHVL